jgi:hypothetical protein
MEPAEPVAGVACAALLIDTCGTNRRCRRTEQIGVNLHATFKAGF